MNTVDILRYKENPAKFLEENSGLLHRVVNKFDMPNSRFSREDLEQEGGMFATIAIEKFDETKETGKLSTYVYTAMFRGIRDLVRDNFYDVKYSRDQQTKDYKNSINEEVAESEWKPKATAIRLDRPTDPDVEKRLTIPSGEPPPIDNMIRQEQFDILNEEINSLSDREKSIIQDRYFNNKTLDEIARAQNCSRQRIFQISKRAMEKLTTKVKGRLGGELFV